MYDDVQQQAYTFIIPTIQCGTHNHKNNIIINKGVDSAIYDSMKKSVRCAIACFIRRARIRLDINRMCWWWRCCGAYYTLGIMTNSPLVCGGGIL